MILDLNTAPLKNVDGHKVPEAVLYQKEYVSQYLKDEIRCFRWIQLSAAEIEEIQKENDEFDRGIGFKYIDGNSGRTMYKFHVNHIDNTHDKFTDTKFGGFLSVRKKMRKGL